MTATEQLPTFVECFHCHDVFLVPYGPPVLERYWAEKAADWFANHRCAT